MISSASLCVFRIGVWLGLSIVTKGAFCLGRQYYFVNVIGKFQQNRTDKNVTNIYDKSEARLRVCVLDQNKKVVWLRQGNIAYCTVLSLLEVNIKHVKVNKKSCIKETCLQLFSPAFFYLFPPFHLTVLQGDAICNEHTLGKLYLARLCFPGFAHGCSLLWGFICLQLAKAYVPAGLSPEVFLDSPNQWLIYLELLSLYSVAAFCPSFTLQFWAFLFSDEIFLCYLNNIVFPRLLCIFPLINRKQPLPQSIFIDHLLSTGYFSSCWKSSR